VNGQDREKFREFMVSRWPGLVRLGYALTGDWWLAEDLAQTALAGACAAWWRVSRAEDPDAYVRRILINASNRRFRRRRPPEYPSGLPEPDYFSPSGPYESGTWVNDPARTVWWRLARSALATSAAPGGSCRSRRSATIFSSTKPGSQKADR